MADEKDEKVDHILRYNSHLEYEDDGYKCKICNNVIHACHRLARTSKDARETNELGCNLSKHKKMAAIRASCHTLEMQNWTIVWPTETSRRYYQVIYPTVTCPNKHEVKGIRAKLVRRDEIICPKCVKKI